MDNKKTYVLHEWDSVRTTVGVLPDPESTNQINKTYASYKTEIARNKNKVIGKLDNRSIDVINNLLFNHGNNVGILETNDEIRLEFKPKFDRRSIQESSFWSFLPKMLSTLYDFDEFNDKLFIDPDSKLLLPIGLNYVPLLAISFMSLCDKVLKVGLLRKYVKKTERLRTIKGKIDFSKLSTSKAWERTSIPCQYFDLTIDNIENQIILWCANRLIKSLRALEYSNDESYVSRKLREQFAILSQEITLRPVSKTEILNINFQSAAPHYTDLMNLCKAILQESLFSFNETEKKANIGVNFIIDMDWVFEQYMTYLFQKSIVKSKYASLQVNPQSWQALCDRGRIKIKPDLIIYKNKCPVAILDFKWKPFESKTNTDFYQIICYALAQIDKVIGSGIEANLFCVSANETEIMEIDTISTILLNNKEIKIRKIPLCMKLFNNENPQIIENSIAETITNYLDTLI